MRIFINAGHGGSDCGAVSKSGTKEADIALKVSNILIDRLKLNGYPITFYQQKKTYTEISNEENKSGATLFISIHCNSSVNSMAHGVEVLYNTYSVKGKQFAEIMQNELVKRTGLTNRGVKARSDLHVLNRTKAPAILVEMAFISNPAEEKLLKENPKMFADSIWEAIKIYNQKGMLS